VRSQEEGNGFLAMEFKSVYSEIQDTQVDVLRQDVSAPALRDLLGDSTSMDVDVDRCGGRAKSLNESAAGAP
jgi:hypothetical protein